MREYSGGRRHCQPGALRQVDDWLATELQRLFPPTCLLCLDPGQPPALDLCSACEADLPANLPACPRCAATLAAEAAACRCGGARRWAVDAVLAPWRYAFPVDALVRRLKFAGQLGVARILGTLLGRAVAARGTATVDALVPVPLHASRQWRRGYNQSREIASFVAAVSGLPLLDGVLHRARATVEQTGLDAAARRRNLRGAFTVAGPLPARVAIIDDVLTTGATAGSLAAALKRAGCRRVEAWVVARA